jgi:hypothetical protein
LVWLSLANGPLVRISLYRGIYHDCGMETTPDRGIAVKNGLDAISGIDIFYRI